MSYLIVGAQVVTPDGTQWLDVRVRDEKIVALTPSGAAPPGDAEIIDAHGKILVPGGIDPHVHSAWQVPGPDGDVTYSAGPEHVSRAALWGGTTTWIDFVRCGAGESLESAINAREALWRGSCYSDYSFHLFLEGQLDQRTLDELPDVIAEGLPSVKMFTTDLTPSRKGRKLNHGEIWQVLKVLSQHNGIAAIHAEDDDLVMHAYERLRDTGAGHFTDMSSVHSSVSEDIAFRRVIGLAEHLEGAALYMMHVSSEHGVRAIEDSRSRGFPVYGETLHQYALFSEDAYARPNGQIYHTYPSLKSRRDMRRLWDGMRHGSIGTIATDGICTPLKVKIQGSSVEDVTGGNVGVEPRMAVMYSEAVIARGFSLEEFVRLTSTNAARIMGLYPQKGAIAVGSDADLVVLDPSIRKRIAVSDLHESDYSPWEGWEVFCWPTITMLRGRIVVKDGAFQDVPKAGRRVHRRLFDDVVSPASPAW
jgi:dihydropyrimidinase